MSNVYDCIVIGTGCGGAGAAALAAHRGWKTLVLEKNKIPGGRCATHTIRGFQMDHGHVFGRSGKGPHGKLLKQINCKDLIPRFAYLSGAAHDIHLIDKLISMPDANNIFSLGYHNLIASLKLRFSPKVWVQGLRAVAAVARIRKSTTRKLDNVPANEWFNQYTDSVHLRSLFNSLCCVSFGALPEEASAGEIIRIMKTIMYEMGIGYPVNGEGSSAVPKSFLRAAERLGAEIRLHTLVDRVVVEDGRVTGVIVDGEFISADRVISNVGLRETVTRLVGEDHFDADYVKRLNNLKYSYGGISLKYALDKPLVRWKVAGKIPPDFDRNMTDAFEGQVPQSMSIMAVATSNIDPSLAPPGRQIILAITPGPVAEPGQTDWREWRDKFKSEMRALVPGIDEHTLFCITSTPDVIAKQAGRICGDAVGVAQTIDQVGDNAPQGISPIEGLYYVGADIGSTGIATEMATQSALDLFEKI